MNRARPIYSVAVKTAAIFLRSQAEYDGSGRKLIHDFFRPFNNAHSVSVNHVIGTKINKIFAAFKTVNIHMIKRHFAVIFAYETECWACNGF